MRLYNITLLLILILLPFRLCNANGVTNYDWTQQEWVNNEKAYLEADKIINKEISGSKDYGEAVINRYKEIALKNPPDELAYYKYGYSVYVSFQDTTIPNDLYLNRRNECLNSLYLIKQSYTYHYTRLLFLLGYEKKSMRWLGEKLIKYNPNDNAVISKQIVILATALLYNADSETKKLAIKYANLLIKREPNIASHYMRMALIYDNIIGPSHDPDNAKMAIKYYKIFLKKANTNHHSISYVKTRISRINGWLKLGHWPDINGQ